VPGLYPGARGTFTSKCNRHSACDDANVFPNEPQNKRDGLYDAVLEMKMKDAKTQGGTFDFVLDEGVIRIQQPHIAGGIRPVRGALRLAF